MKNINKDLVIIGSNEFSEIEGKYFFRSGLETQMDHLAQSFRSCYHYSPKSEDTFSGYTFSNQVCVRAFSHIHHKTHKELLFRLREYWHSVRKIYEEHQDAIFLVFIPDSYIGLIAAQYLKMVKANFFVRVTSDHMQEMKQREKTIIRSMAYIFLKPIYYLYMKKLFNGIVQIYTGKKIYYDNNYAFSINSSNLTQKDIIKKNQIEKLNGDKIKVLYVGRFDSIKGLHVLIDAMDYVKSDIVLNIVGFDTPYNTEVILKKIESSRNAQKINFIGYIPYGDKLFSYYDSSDILVFPSLQDAQGKTFLEAMARGCVVIATKVGSVADIIKHMTNGYLVEPNNPYQIAEALDILSLNPTACLELSENGYNTATENTVEVVSATIINAICKFNLDKV